MCRFALYLGKEIPIRSLITDPDNSIIHQSYHSHEREEPLNGDGFGLAWYVPHLSPEPALFRSTTPAWSDVNLINLARVTRTDCLLAHVRAATPGLPVIQLNCHPFVWGRFAFMHNGEIGGFRHIKRRLRERLSDDSYDLIQGSTDSEHIFALFAEHYGQGRGPEGGIESIRQALQAAINSVNELRRRVGIEEPCRLNLAITDGTCAVVTRWTSQDPEKANTLYSHSGGRYYCQDGICRMRPAAESGPGAVIVSSERLNEDDPGWNKIPVNHMVLVHPDLQVEVRAMQAA